jgi:hypothetical protein
MVKCKLIFYKKKKLNKVYGNLYLCILLHYLTYNNTITITMQLNLTCMFSFPFSLHVSDSVGHHQVLLPTKIIIILRTKLKTKHFKQNNLSECQ